MDRYSHRRGSGNDGVPKPPFRHRWSIQTPGYFHDLGVADGIAYMATDGAVAAIRLRDGVTEWFQPCPPSRYGGSMDVGEDSIFVFDHGPARVTEFDRRTGRIRWQKDLPKMAQHTYRDGVLFLGWERQKKAFTYAAIDVKTKQPRWVRPMASTPPAYPYRAMSTPRAVFVEGFDYPLDIETGNDIPGHEPLPHSVQAVYGEIALVHGASGWEARDAGSGALLWRNDRLGFTSSIIVHGDNFAFRNEEGVIALDPRTGKVVWDYPLKPKPVPSSSLFFRKPHPFWDPREGEMASLGDTLWVQDTMVHALDLSGNRRWRTARLNGIDAVWSDGDVVAMREDNRLFGYAAGELEPAPRGEAARRRWAEEMAPRHQGLDPWERKRMSDLGEDAFDALFAAARKPLEPPHYLEQALFEAVGPQASHKLVTALSMTIDREWRARLIQMMRYTKDPDVTGPRVLDELLALPLSDWPGNKALDAVLASEYEPAALHLWKAYEDPDSAPSVREAILWKIAGLGPWAAGKVAEEIRARPLRPEHWPDVRRVVAERDIEHALEAVFALTDKEAPWYRGKKDKWAMEVNFPRGVTPFAMRGTEVICLTRPDAMETGAADYSFSLSLKDEIQDEYAEGTTLQIMVGRVWGPRAGHWIAVFVRKVQGAWVPVGRTLVAIS